MLDASSEAPEQGSPKAGQHGRLGAVMACVHSLHSRLHVRMREIRLSSIRGQEHMLSVTYGRSSNNIISL